MAFKKQKKEKEKTTLEQILELCKLEFKVDAEMYYEDAHGIEFPITKPSDYYNIVCMTKQSENSSGMFYLAHTKRSRRIAQFKLSMISGSYDVLLSSASEIQFDYRKKGLGTLLCRFREDLAKSLSDIYTLLAIVSNSNEPQIKIMKACGWDASEEINEKITLYKSIIFVKSLI